MAVALEVHPRGVVLPVKAQPGARQKALRGEHGSALKVSVTQVAEKGKANDAIVAVLCETLGLSRSQVELLSGATASQKRFLIVGVAPAELASRIEDALRW